MSRDDYAKIKASERHHFIHLNVTSRGADGCHHMTFSRNVAAMLRQELGIELVEFVARDADGTPQPLDHPCDAKVVPLEDLHATRACAPGHHRDGTPKLASDLDMVAR
jgi:hypothetical protein